MWILHAYIPNVWIKKTSRGTKLAWALWKLDRRSFSLTMIFKDENNNIYQLCMYRCTYSVGASLAIMDMPYPGQILIVNWEISKRKINHATNQPTKLNFFKGNRTLEKYKLKTEAEGLARKHDHIDICFGLVIQNKVNIIKVNGRSDKHQNNSFKDYWIL